MHTIKVSKGKNWNDDTIKVRRYKSQDINWITVKKYDIEFNEMVVEEDEQ